VIWSKSFVARNVGCTRQYLVETILAYDECMHCILGYVSLITFIPKISKNKNGACGHKPCAEKKT
jgi:hypothetical protein